jgi:hypothetical protein
MAGGNNHAVALRSDGVMVAFGSNNYGQCNVPALPPGLQYVQVGAGWNESIALRSDGAIIGFGSNLQHELEPPSPPPGTRFVAIAMHSFHCTAVYEPIPPGAPVCSGDGLSGTCPCGNNGQSGHGCANSIDPAGASLTATGSASIANDTLLLAGSGMPSSACLYFEGTNLTPTSFGDGLRCAGGALVRLGIRQNTAGSSTVGAPNDPPISARRPDHPGDFRLYQVWYRNLVGPCGTGTNLTNAWNLVWQP